jgi:hypothetical protein
MRLISKLVMAAAMIGASAYAGAQSVVYDVSDFQLGNGDYLSGTIDLTSTSAKMGGNLSSSSFASASIGLYSSTGLIEQYGTVLCGFACGLNLSSGQITVDPFNLANIVSFAKAGCCATAIRGGGNSSFIIPSSGWPQFLSANFTGSVFATAAAPQSAAEIDPGFAASGLALLLGGLAVLGGRRSRGLSA